MLKVAMKIEKRSFVNGNGEEIGYLACVSDIHGEEIRFQVKNDDKKLFEYLTKEDDLLPEEED